MSVHIAILPTHSAEGEAAWRRVEHQVPGGKEKQPNKKANGQEKKKAFKKNPYSTQKTCQT